MDAQDRFMLLRSYILLDFCFLPRSIDFGNGFEPVMNRDKVVDFHWDSCDPWTIVSVSEDANTPGGGGTLQVRMHQIPLFASHFYKLRVQPKLCKASHNNISIF